jgi:hypothetical protein
MNISDRLFSWNALWRIAGGVVSCRTCKFEQAEGEQASVFIHSEDCEHAAHPTYPWATLDRIETGMPRKSLPL